MSNSKKLLIAAFAVIFLIGATPLFAELDGIWEGYGEGSCYAPDGTLIYPWQNWIGDVLNGTFEGVWEDSDGNYGDFHGGIISFYISVEPPSHTFAHCEGTWTWVSSEGTIPIEMGPFSMEFNLDLETCDGEWWSYSGPGLGGHMWGERIGP